MKNTKILISLVCLWVLLPVLKAQNSTSDTILFGGKKMYNTIGFQNENITTSRDGKFDEGKPTIDGYGKLEIFKNWEEGNPYSGKVVGKITGGFKDGYVDGFAKVEVDKVYTDGSIRFNYLEGYFEEGDLINYNTVHSVISNYLKGIEYSEYFKVNIIEDFSYRIFKVEITSAPFCEELIMGFRAVARIYFKSNGKTYDFNLTLRKPNLFEPMQYKFTGRNEFTYDFLIDEGLKSTARFIMEKNWEELGLKNPPEKIGVDKYKNTFGYWIEELPEPILDIGREQIILAAKRHNEKYENIRDQNTVLSGVFYCESTNQIFYFNERGESMGIADLTHAALTKVNEYDYYNVSLKYLDSSEFQFETFEKEGFFSITNRYQILSWPNKGNGYSAFIKNGKYEYALKMIGG